MLDQPVTALPGIGKEKAKLLVKLGLKSIRDVIFSYPRSYHNYCQIFSPDQAENDQEGLFSGPLVNIQEKSLNKNRRLIQGRLLGITKSLTVSWFTVMRGRGGSYLYRQLKKSSHVWVYGTVKEGLYGLELPNGDWYTKQPSRLGLQPVYPLVAGITNAMRLRWIEFALDYINQIYECLPSVQLQTYMAREDALSSIHFPKNQEQLDKAKQRLIFEEFFLFHLSLSKLETDQQFIQHQADGQLTKKYLANLPFELTPGQEKAIVDVREDMEAPLQMRRLIHGDVGSGKTVIAEYAAIKAVNLKGQVAVMVPTEILARQMHSRLAASLGPLGVEVALLIGKSPTKAQRHTLTGLASGTIPVVVGTHALISHNVEFKRLTLAVVDEQHRFGVRQRIALSDKGHADLLVMSATPIPRSLALTLYGDLNNTVIRDLPAGRKLIDTRLIHPNRRGEVYRFLVNRVKQGEQGFVIFPLVEESDKLEAKAAIQEMDILSKGLLSSVRVGLVHGQMGKEKEEVMEGFYQQKLDILISTTVIEVGMNVPNATVMVIEDAHRFGLAQLHQLRGRVGRSSNQAYCFLISEPKTDIARDRLHVIRSTNDGLKIAEEDLKLRGPGDLLGTRQSGQPWFKLADLIEDQELLEKAAYAARQLILENPTLSEYPTLLKEVKRQQP